MVMGQVAQVTFQPHHLLLEFLQHHLDLRLLGLGHLIQERPGTAVVLVVLQDVGEDALVDVQGDFHQLHFVSSLRRKDAPDSQHAGLRQSARQNWKWVFCWTLNFYCRCFYCKRPEINMDAIYRSIGINCLTTQSHRWKVCQLTVTVKRSFYFISSIKHFFIWCCSMFHDLIKNHTAATQTPGVLRWTRKRRWLREVGLVWACFYGSTGSAV